MYALVLRHRTTPSGVIIIHETNEPVLVGTTPLSTLLLDKYTKGFSITVYDRTMHKKREGVVPPKDLKFFLNVGASYFALANMLLTQESYIPSSSNSECYINIDGTRYLLKEIT